MEMITQNDRHKTRDQRPEIEERNGIWIKEQKVRVGLVSLP